MPIALDRSRCCDLDQVIEREWLITNKVGGYAAGTIAGVLTRREHSLLVGLAPGTATPQLLIAKIDEEVIFDQRTYYLGTNEYRDRTLNPVGFVHLEAFRIEDGFPVFTYHLGGNNGVQLEKRIWMPQDQNTTCIQYRILHTANTTEGHRFRESDLLGLDNSPVRITGEKEAWQPQITLNILPFVTYRPCNEYDTKVHTRDQFKVKTHQQTEDKGAGCTITSHPGAISYHILAVGQIPNIFLPTGVWYWNFLHRHEQPTPEQAYDNLYLPGVIRANLQINQENCLTILLSTEDCSRLPLRASQLHKVYIQTLEIEKHIGKPERYFGDGGEASRAEHIPILPFTHASDPYRGGKEFLQLLLRANDHFIAYRSGYHPGESDQKGQSEPGCSNLMPVVYTDYFRTEMNTRETLIALPGLTLIPEKYSEARQILRRIAKYFKDGLLPDNLPLPGQRADKGSYNNVDCALWYFYALDHYLRATHDENFLREVYPVLKDVIHRYKYGTENGIQVDTRDGLLRAEHYRKALTWMNASTHSGLVTRRAGKPVEVNALWQHALYLMHAWAKQYAQMGHFGYSTSDYEDFLLQCQQSFQKRFWYAKGGYCYDVIDGPEGNDESLRPNQIIALALPSLQLEEPQRLSIFEIVTRYLLTPYGLRTLSPQDREYQGDKGESDGQRTPHRGSSWVWLIGFYSEAMLSLHHPWSEKAAPRDEHLCKEYLWRKGLKLLEPFREQLNNGLLGMCEGVFSGDPPHRAGARGALAVSTAELLRIYNLLAQMHIAGPGHREYR